MTGCLEESGRPALGETVLMCHPSQASNLRMQPTFRPGVLNIYSKSIPNVLLHSTGFYQLANICLHLIIEAKRDVSGVTPGKKYATDDGPPVAADDAAAARFHPISVSAVVILCCYLINLRVTSLPKPDNVFCVRSR